MDLYIQWSIHLVLPDDYSIAPLFLSHVAPASMMLLVFGEAEIEKLSGGSSIITWQPRLGVSTGELSGKFEQTLNVT